MCVKRIYNKTKQVINVKKLAYILTFIITVLIIFILIANNINLKRELKYANEHNTLPDTTYNHKVLDSISYNISKKDTIIYNYKTQMSYEIEKSYTIDNDSAVKLFYRLLSED